MSGRKTYRDVLTFASAIVGGERALAVLLGASIGAVLTWLYGIDPIPDNIFLRAVDLVSSATADDLARAGDLLDLLRDHYKG